MIRVLLIGILLLLVARAFWKVMDGVIEAGGGTTRSRRAQKAAVKLVRDPVCGTYVLPARSVTLSAGGRLLHFCSAACRDTYRTRSSTGASGHVAGSTA